MKARLLIPPVVLLVLCCALPECLRAEETGPVSQADLESDLEIEREKRSQLAAELGMVRDEYQDEEQQDTPAPLETVDIELLEKANESLRVALDLLGEDVSSGPIDQALYENSMRIARSVAALCRGRRCERSSPDE